MEHSLTTYCQKARSEKEREKIMLEKRTQGDLQLMLNSRQTNLQ